MEHLVNSQAIESIANSLIIVWALLARINMDKHRRRLEQIWNNMFLRRCDR